MATTDARGLIVSDDKVPPALLDRDGQVLALVSGDVSPRALLQRLVGEGQPLHGADLARLVREWPSNHTFDDALLDFADLRGCQASGLSFRRARLRGAVLRNAVMRSVDLTEADLSGAILDGAGMPGAILRCARLGPLPQTFRMAARHNLRPEMDEFVPFHRCLARTTDLSRADMREARILQADLSGAELSGADMRGARVERTNFEGADLRDVRFDQALVFRCILCSPTLHQATADGSVFRSNIYLELPGVPQILEAGWRFPYQLFHYLREEARQRRAMPRTMRIDLDRMLAIKLIVMLSIPTIVSVAWHTIETAPGVGTVLAFGALSVFAARRYVTMFLQAVISALLGRLNDAEGALLAGRPIAALAVLVLPGLVSERIAPRPEAEQRDPDERLAPIVDPALMGPESYRSKD